jgi:hypothetical protein
MEEKMAAQVDCGEVKLEAVQLSDPENERVEQLFRAIGVLKLSILKSRGKEITEETIGAWQWSNQHLQDGRWVLVKHDIGEGEDG